MWRWQCRLWSSRGFLLQEVAQRWVQVILSSSTVSAAPEPAHGKVVVFAPLTRESRQVPWGKKLSTVRGPSVDDHVQIVLARSHHRHNTAFMPTRDDHSSRLIVTTTIAMAPVGTKFSISNYLVPSSLIYPRSPRASTTACAWCWVRLTAKYTHRAHILTTTAPLQCRVPLVSTSAI